MIDIPDKYIVLPPIIRAQTAPSSMRIEKVMIDSSMQTFDLEQNENNVFKPDLVPITDSTELDANQNKVTAGTPTESRASSPVGYMIAYKMADQKLHFDPGVYTDFKGIDSAKLWLKKKKFLQKKGKKINSGKAQKNLSSIDEDLEANRLSEKSIISSPNDSESDDESLRREAVRQASMVTMEHIIDPPIPNVLVFDASTQTEIECKKPEKKVRISIKSPQERKKEAPKRLTMIEVKESKPSKYLDKYLLKGKKKAKKLPELAPLFSPVKQRPISRSSSSRSSRSSSSASEKAKKTKIKERYSNIQPRVLAHDPPPFNQQDEYQLNPYMPASWYLPYDYLDTSLQTPQTKSPNIYMNSHNAQEPSPNINISVGSLPNSMNNHYQISNYSPTNTPISKPSKKKPLGPSIHNHNMSPMTMYSPVPEISSTGTLYSSTRSTNPSKKSKDINYMQSSNPSINNQYIDPTYQTNSYYQPEPYLYPAINPINSKSFKSTPDLTYNRPWY